MSRRVPGNPHPLSLGRHSPDLVREEARLRNPIPEAEDLVDAAAPPSLRVLDAYFLHRAVLGPLLGVPEEAVTKRLGTVVVRARAELAPVEIAVLAARADLYLPGAWPDVADGWAEVVGALAAPPLTPAPTPASPSPRGLHDWNGYGGFSDDGREYVVRLTAQRDGRLHLPPMPWTNVIANERRRRRRHPEDPIDAAIDLSAPDDPAATAVTRSEASRAWQAVRELPADRRQALELRFIHELSAREIGQVMGRSEAAVRVLIHRALASVRSRLAP